MYRIILYVLATIYVANAFVIFFAPQWFYGIIPGLSMMGPFNMHFIRDVALAYLTSGLAMGWGAWKLNRPVACMGALWPGLHGVFHIQIWFARGLPFDYIAASDFSLVVVPAAVGMWAAAKLAPAE